jgi:hypothetical protein
MGARERVNLINFSAEKSQVNHPISRVTAFLFAVIHYYSSNTKIIAIRHCYCRDIIFYVSAMTIVAVHPVITGMEFRNDGHPETMSADTPIWSVSTGIRILRHSSFSAQHSPQKDRASPAGTTENKTKQKYNT